MVFGNPEYWQEMVRQVVSTRQMTVVEVRSGTRVGRIRVRMVPEMDGGGEVQSVLLMATDVNALHAAEQQAAERQGLIEAVFNATSQAVLAIDGEGRIQLANEVVAQRFGYVMEELMGAPFAMLVPGYLPGERGELLRDEELLARHRDGTEFPVRCRLNHFESAGGVMSVAVVTDITKQREQERQLREAAEEIRALGISLLTAEADMARAVARELHDDITQRLALLSMEIGREAQEQASGRMGEVLRGYQGRLIDISTGLRRISHQMHPAILEHFGLSAAIESLCEEFGGQGVASMEFHAAGVPEGVDRNIALCLYRVCQECLRNIEKHAEADSVVVLLEGREGWLRLTVADPGKGV